MEPQAIYEDRRSRSELSEVFLTFMDGVYDSWKEPQTVDGVRRISSETMNFL